MNDATLRTLIDETVARAIEATPVPKIMPATISDATDLRAVEVIVDGDTDVSLGQSIIGALTANERVMVLFNPPSGMLIFGRCP